MENGNGKLHGGSYTSCNATYRINIFLIVLVSFENGISGKSTPLANDWIRQNQTLVSALIIIIFCFKYPEMTLSCVLIVASFSKKRFWTKSSAIFAVNMTYCTLDKECLHINCSECRLVHSLLVTTVFTSCEDFTASFTALPDKLCDINFVRLKPLHVLILSFSDPVLL